MVWKSGRSTKFCPMQGPPEWLYFRVIDESGEDYLYRRIGSQR
jgi:hypothetical protein